MAIVSCKSGIFVSSCYEITPTISFFLRTKEAIAAPTIRQEKTGFQQALVGDVACPFFCGSRRVRKCFAFAGQRV